MQHIKRFLFLLGPYTKRYFVIVGMVLVFEVIKLLPPYVFSKLLDLLSHYETSLRPSVLKLALLIFLLRGLINVVDRIWEYLNAKFYTGLQFYLYSKAFTKATHMPFVEHENLPSGTQISQVQKGCESVLWEVAGESFWNFWPIVLGLLTSVVMILSINPLLVMIFLLPAPALAFLVYKMNKRLWPVLEEVNAIEDTNWGRFGEVLGNIQVVLAFAKEKWEEARYQENQVRIKGLVFSLFNTEANFFLLWSLIIISSKLGLLFFSIVLIEQSTISLGQLVLVNTLSDMAYSNFYRLYFFVRRQLRAAPKLERLELLFSQPDALKQSPEVIALTAAPQKIEFRGVCFTYPSTYSPNGRRLPSERKDTGETLRGVSFTICQGETVAVVGESGSGKTTLMKLLLRFFEPTQGAIFLDDINLNQIDRLSYLQRIGYVPQGLFLFDGTVHDSIAHGSQEPNQCSLLSVARAARRASAHGFIKSLPDHYETRIGEGGLKLSGGQGQRVMIARSLIKSPNILIFDEATSHLDAQAEKEIQAWVKQQSQTRATTMIIIAHRLSTIAHADKIIVLSDGKIVEQGTHQQLLAMRGTYYRLYQAQNLY